MLISLSPQRIPTKEDGLLDWDCAAALSIPAIQSTLHHIQAHGHPPVRPPFPRLRSRPDPPDGLPLNVPQPSFASKEDLNAVGHCPVPATTIASLKARVAAWTQPGQPGHGLLAAPAPLRMCIFDGFLLYAPSMATIQAHLDIKLFLRVSYARAKARREARQGYATIEGWWADPPGYVDRVVWPNYVADHAWMFEGGDVEGAFREGVLADAGIRAQVGAGADVEMGETLGWAVETLMGALEEMGREGGK